MGQHDYNIANQTFPATRTDLNNLFSAILSMNSGTSAPSTTVAGMLWYDTTNAIIKQRNAADSGWIHLWAIGKQGLIDQNGSTVYAADSVGTDSYAITLTPAITAYAAGQVFRFKAGTANTGAATLNVNGLGAVTLKKGYNSDLVTGDILANQLVEVIYDGTNFQLLSPVSNFNRPYVILQDQKSTNTSGGTFTTGDWRTRDLNTEVVDTHNICTLASNQFTLPAGRYLIRARCPAYRVSNHKTRLRNITDSTTTLEGSSEYTLSTDAVQTASYVIGRFEIAASKTFEIQHQGGVTQSTNGFGIATNFGTEIYTSVEIWQEF